MHRNLDRRVEALVRVSDPVARAELDHVLTAAMSPDVDAFELAGDGTWTRRTGGDETPGRTCRNCCCAASVARPADRAAHRLS